MASLDFLLQLLLLSVQWMIPHMMKVDEEYVF
jgi:hypothetical protein